MAVMATIAPAPIGPTVPPQVPGSTLEGIKQGVDIVNKNMAAWYHYWYVKQHPYHPAVSTSAAPRTGGVNWDGIARCETAGNWHMQGSRFSGGLGFYNGAWNDFGGREFAANAGQATREQQIVVAERIRARFGLSGWGCRAAG